MSDEKIRWAKMAGRKGENGGKEWMENGGKASGVRGMHEDGRWKVKVEVVAADRHRYTR